MSNRAWFYASDGKQQGPCQEAELRELIARHAVTAETLVWSEGMAGWQRAGDIPGLFARPPGMPAGSGGVVAIVEGDSGDPLSIELGIWPLIWRSLVLFISLMFIIPVPWAVAMYCRWMVSCVRVPRRPNLTFTGRPVELMWYYAAVAALFGVALIESDLLNVLIIVIQVLLYWLLIRWFIANIASDGLPLGLKFSGSFWGYLGWNVLALVSTVTIIGWAWVYTAQIRWMCRRVEGTRREVVFNATGLQFLWRSLVAALGCAFVIPIPWLLRWLLRWQVSQVALVERAASASV